MNPPVSSPSVSLHVTYEKHLDVLLQKFWQQEVVPSNPLLTPDEQKCEDHFIRAHSRDDNGRFIVKLPFKDRNQLRPLNLGESVGRASAMLRLLKKKFERDKKLKVSYHDFLHEFILFIYLFLLS